MTEDEVEEQHESYGTISISRMSGSVQRGGLNITGVTLFDSPIKHSNWLALRISRCKVYRSLYQTRRHTTKELIEVYLSQTQFAEMITSISQGEGSACTISRINRVAVANPPEDENEHDKIRLEFEKKMRSVADKFTGDIKAITVRLDDKAPLKASERSELKEKLRMLEQELRMNMPFVQECFVEAVEKNLHVAKTEINYHAQLVATQRNLTVEEVKLIGQDQTTS